MKKEFGITYTLNLDWVRDNMFEIEFEDPLNESLLLFDEEFYYQDDLTEDWKLVDNQEYENELEYLLLNLEEVKTKFIEYVADSILQLSYENDIINNIYEVEND